MEAGEEGRETVEDLIGVKMRVMLVLMLFLVCFYVESTLLMVLMTLVMTTTLTRARSRMAMKECWNFPRLVLRWILSFFPEKEFSHLVLLQI